MLSGVSIFREHARKLKINYVIINYVLVLKSKTF